MPFPRVIQSMIPMKRFIGVFPNIAVNTAAKQTITFNVTAAFNYLDIYLRLTNLAAANFQEIRLKIGADVIQKWTGTDLDAILQYDLLPASATYATLKLPLRRMGLRGGMNVVNFAQSMFLSGSARDLAYESSLNCGSAGGGFQAIKDVSIECDIINTGGNQALIEMYSRCTAPVPGGPGAVYRVDLQNKNIANGRVTITKSEMGLDALRPFINRIVLVPAAGTLDNFQLRYGTNDWWKVDANLLNFTQTEDKLRAIQVGYYVFDFQEEGFGDEMLDMSDSAADILFQFDSVGAAGNLAFYVHTLGLPFSATPGV